VNRPSRRAVVRTGVWAVPVVPTAAAAARASAGTGEAARVTIDGIGSLAGPLAPGSCHPKDGDASDSNANRS
jgi:hypothetical protein